MSQALDTIKVEIGTVVDFIKYHVRFRGIVVMLSPPASDLAYIAVVGSSELQTINKTYCCPVKDAKETLDLLRD